MALITTIESLPNGARFQRADLHIHSFGGSHDVKDKTMTPESIVKTALAEKLDLIAITDHNEIRNVEPMLTAAVKQSLLVIPAVELSTAGGHLLCYLPTHDALLKFFGRITVVDRNSPNSRCQNSLLDCLNHLNDVGGFGVLAHVDIESGFEIETPGNSPHKTDVLCHKALLGIELKTSTSDISYSAADPEVNRVNNGKERIKRLRLGAKQYLARVLNSDSHSLHALGKNAQGDRKVTRIKMDRPSFEALRIALEDSDARIRIEDHVPPTVPHVLGIHIDGGFLDGQQIHFNPNLNCIIGGRGTGKSTTFEAVRCLTGESSNSTLVDCEVWPSELSLFWRDQAGQVHTLCRPLDGVLSNLDDPVNGPIAFSVESYGQGETAQISKQAQGNPVALLSYLDRFVDIAEASTAENAARDELLSLQEQIEKASQNVGLIPQYERALTTTQQQLAALEQANAKDVIELQRKLAAEREIRTQINTQITQIERGLDSFSAKTMVDEIVSLGDPTPFSIGAEEFDKIVAGCRSFQTEVGLARSQAKVSFQKLQKTAETQLTSWKAKEAEALKTIEIKRKRLEAQNIRLDMAYIQKLSKDEAKFKADLATLRNWKPHLQELQRKRSTASKKRWEARELIATLRDSFGRAATETLKVAQTDLVVSLKFLRNGYSPDAEQQIIQAMGWRTIQVPRAALLIQRLTVPGLLNALDKQDANSIMSVTTDEGAKIFDKSEAEQIIERLGEPSIRFALERCEVHDLPRLTVTKTLVAPYGKKQHVTRDFSRLSLGQQQSVLLALMLSSKSNAPAYN